MTNELLNLHGMNIMMAEDANEPSLRIRPHHKTRRKDKPVKDNKANETFLRMLTAR